MTRSRRLAERALSVQLADLRWSERNGKDAPFSAIPVADHLPPSRVLRIAGTAANRCGSQINDGSKGDVDLR